MKHSTHNALALLASLLAVSLIVSALRQRRLSVGPPRRAPSIRVGFVGNSFTYYNDLPGVLARATGVAVDACTRGGASLASLLRDGGDSTGHAAVRFAKAALARARGADASTKRALEKEAAEAARVAADATNGRAGRGAGSRGVPRDAARRGRGPGLFARTDQDARRGRRALQRLAPLLREARVVVRRLDEAGAIRQRRDNARRRRPPRYNKNGAGPRGGLRGVREGVTGRRGRNYRDRARRRRVRARARGRRGAMAVLVRPRRVPPVARGDVPRGPRPPPDHRDRAWTARPRSRGMRTTVPRTSPTRRAGRARPASSMGML